MAEESKDYYDGIVVVEGSSNISLERQKTFKF